MEKRIEERNVAEIYDNTHNKNRFISQAKLFFVQLKHLKTKGAVLKWRKCCSKPFNKS
jgi:hypothetical protein